MSAVSVALGAVSAALGLSSERSIERRERSSERSRAKRGALSVPTVPNFKFEILKFPKIDHNFEILLEVLKNSVGHGEHAEKV